MAITLEQAFGGGSMEDRYLDAVQQGDWNTASMLKDQMVANAQGSAPISRGGWGADTRAQQAGFNEAGRLAALGQQAQQQLARQTELDYIERVEAVKDAERMAALRNTEGLAGQMMADPRMQAALDAVQGRLEGPYTDAVQAGLYSQASDMAGAAQQAQNAALQRQTAASGGSIYDPSYQAQQRQNMAQRQATNQASRRDIAVQAALGNYTGGMQAAGQLASTRMGQYGQAAPMMSQAANIHTSYNETPIEMNTGGTRYRTDTPQSVQSGGATNYGKVI